MKQLLQICLLSLLGFGLAGCASYKLGAVKDPGFKTIFIENFKSQVDEPGLENLVTTTVIKEFQNDGTLRVVSMEQADVILRGKITAFETTPLRYSRQNELTPTEAGMSIEVTYTLTKKGQEKPYQEAKVTGATTFFIGNDLQGDKRQGVPLASEKLGRELLKMLVEGW
ncbi:MAG: LptE family protein [Verrucomicrobiae bacterium]|nr:LptE family protein [Verrucomicrobiae bacterium]